jgi:hypothetical protein
MVKLKKQIYVYENEDKKDHEKPIPSEPTYLLHPCSCVFIGPPSHGKSNMMANIILDAYRCNRPFKRIILCHYLGNLSHEYDIFSDIMETLPEVPTSVDDLKIDPTQKTCIIFEDIDPRGLKHPQRSFLDRCFGVVSSHLGCTILMSAQQVIAIPVGCRRLASHFFIWRCGGSREDLILLARKCGIKKQDLEYYFDNILTSKYDCLHINVYNTDAARITKNLHEVIKQ